MILEVLRALTDWLNDGTNGVVAQLAFVPLDGADQAPAVGTIADETRNNFVAQGRLPSTPGLGVNSAGITELDPEVVTIERDGEIEVHIRYGIDNPDSATAVGDTSYVLRAVVRSLRLFNAATRTRGGVAVYGCEKLRVVALWKPLTDQVITGAVITTLRFRDTSP